MQIYKYLLYVKILLQKDILLGFFLFLRFDSRFTGNRISLLISGHLYALFGNIFTAINPNIPVMAIRQRSIK